MPAGFVDEARIRVRGGDGGSGSASFHREKYRPKGGPDGGDGGHGGSISLIADTGTKTLADFRYRRAFQAESGAAGGGNNRRGRDGSDLEVRVPPGTLVRDAATGELLADLAAPGARYTVARGGRGGRGNASISSAVDRAPNFAERGEPGEEMELVLDLRIVADVGLLGLPNAGKSSLLRAVSAATPKVADYPFTTLEPILGVVQSGGGRFVVADLPGLIEGAAEGRGLGTRFLRHASRCAVLALVVDVTSQGADTVLEEVASYDDELAERVRVVVANKIDLAEVPETLAAWASERRMELLRVSALHGDGVVDLVARLADLVERARADRPAAETFAVFRPVEEDRIRVSREHEGWRVSSARVERAVVTTPLGNARAVRHLQRKLKSMGVEAALKRAGANEGDDVHIAGMTFEYHPEP